MHIHIQNQWRAEGNSQEHRQCLQYLKGLSKSLRESPSVESFLREFQDNWDSMLTSKNISIAHLAELLQIGVSQIDSNIGIRPNEFDTRITCLDYISNSMESLSSKFLAHKHNLSIIDHRNILRAYSKLAIAAPTELANSYAHRFIDNEKGYHNDPIDCCEALWNISVQHIISRDAVYKDIASTLIDTLQDVREDDGRITLARRRITLQACAWFDLEYPFENIPQENKEKFKESDFEKAIRAHVKRRYDTKPRKAINPKVQHIPDIEVDIREGKWRYFIEVDGPTHIAGEQKNGTLKYNGSTLLQSKVISSVVPNSTLLRIKFLAGQEMLKKMGNQEVRDLIKYAIKETYSRREESRAYTLQIRDDGLFILEPISNQFVPEDVPNIDLELKYELQKNCAPL